MRRFFILAVAVTLVAPMSNAAAADDRPVPPGLSGQCVTDFYGWLDEVITAETFAERCLDSVNSAFELRFPAPLGESSAAAAPATLCTGYVEKPARSTLIVGTIFYGAWMTCNGAMTTVYLRAELQAAAKIEPNFYAGIHETVKEETFYNYALAYGNFPCPPNGVASNFWFRTYAFATGQNSEGMFPTRLYSEAVSTSVGGGSLC